MKKFAKIVETNERQVLVTKQYNTETDTDEVKVETEGKTCRLNAIFSFDNEDDQDSFFKKFEDLKFTDMIVMQCFGFAI